MSEKFIGHADKSGWWLYAIAKTSGHRSAVGPFESAEKASEYQKEYREQENWRNISIMLRQGKRR